MRRLNALHVALISQLVRGSEHSKQCVMQRLPSRQGLAIAVHDFAIDLRGPLRCPGRSARILSSSERKLS